MRVVFRILFRHESRRPAAAQDPPPELVPPSSWTEPAEPIRIVGPIYFVGTKGLAAYLVTTPKGHILLDGAMPGSAKDIEASIRKLGFKPEEIRILLITHAHIDHAGTTAYFKKLAKAKAAVMDRDYIALASGGRTDFRYGSQPAFYFPPVKAERELTDGETVSLGRVSMTARLGAGHTRGATTWTTTVEDGGRKYTVVFPCCTGINPGYRLTVDPSYAGIADDYRRTFAMLESLKPDIWLPAHTESFDFEAKRARGRTRARRPGWTPTGIAVGREGERDVRGGRRGGAEGRRPRSHADAIVALGASIAPKRRRLLSRLSWPEDRL